MKEKDILKGIVLKADYEIALNGYFNTGCSKDWLSGYVSCLYINRLVSLVEANELLIFVEKISKTKRGG